MEVVIILVVLSIIAALAIPLALRIFTVTAENTTNTEMQNLKNAMIGDPDKLASSQRADFGYLGDVGCLPGSIQDLLTKPSGVPNYSFSSTAQIGAGWRGPYITGAATGQETDTFTKDEWGNSYTYTPAGTPACPPNATATFRSGGVNATFDGVPPTGDDIDYSIASTDSTSTVSGFVKDGNGNPVGSSTVDINYPVQGTLVTATGTTNSSGFYSISNIPFGKRSITFPAGSPKLIVTFSRSLTSTDSAVCGVSSCTLIEFNIVNFSTSAVSVSNLTATYTVTPAAFYYRIIWGSTTAFDCTAPPGPACGTGSTVTATFSASQSVAAASTAIKPVVFVVDQSQEELADIQIGKGGEVGTAVRVQIINFRDCSSSRTCGGATAQVSMAGVTFTVTFSDGSTVKFTPL